MKKVTCPIFDGHDYPKWKAMMKKCLMAMNSELWTVTVGVKTGGSRVGGPELCV